MMGKVEDIFGRLFGEDFSDKFKVKDYYTLDDAKEIIEKDGVANRLIHLEAMITTALSLLIVKNLITKDEYEELFKTTHDLILDREAQTRQKSLNDGVEKVGYRK